MKSEEEKERKRERVKGERGKKERKRKEGSGFVHSRSAATSELRDRRFPSCSDHS